MSNEHDKNVVYGDGFHDGYLKGRSEGWDAAIEQAYADGNKSVPLYRHPPTIAVPEGWQLVPVDLTNAMLEAWFDVPSGGRSFDARYKAMLAAATQQGGAL